MKIACAALACAATLIAGPVHAEGDVVDPRALDECEGRGGTFVAISDCLPDVHVAIRGIDAFKEVHGEAGLPLLDRCAELNDNESEPTLSCIRDAMEAALELAARLPEGREINDPLFAIIADQAASDAVEQAIKDARDAFPDVRFWGGGLFHQYR